MRFPASRCSFRIRFSAFDVLWAAATPLLALYLRDVQLGSFTTAELFWLVSFASALPSFLVFRIREGVAHHFSVHDALQIGKAVLLTELLTMVVLFTAVRLEGIPRPIPIIHALILSAGLILYRVAVRLRHDIEPRVLPLSVERAEQIVIIGCTRLSSLYMRMMKAYSARAHKVVAILDDDPQAIGRAVDGVRVIAPPGQLESVIEEFAEHGISIDRVLLGGDRELLSPETMDEIENVCSRHDLKLDFLPQLAGLDACKGFVSPSQERVADAPTAEIRLPAYFRFKRVADVAIGLILLVLLSPAILLVAIIILFDVGSPIFFWQQRLGFQGRTFLLHKFRTLKPPYNERGLPIAASDRLSRAGSLIRKMRLDELPQLLNVVVGDMSLIGPRPLLPRDQPSDATIRLMVKPGITGWAQVNGATLLTPEEKNDLDDWYIRNASLWLDLRILLMTLSVVCKLSRPVYHKVGDIPDTRNV